MRSLLSRTAFTFSRHRELRYPHELSSSSQKFKPFALDAALAPSRGVPTLHLATACFGHMLLHCVAIQAYMMRYD